MMTSQVVSISHAQIPMSKRHIITPSKELIYLATPFSHKQRWVMKLRWDIITALASKLVADGNHVYSPITESHCIDEFGLKESGWAYWAEHDCLMIDKCDEVWVATLPGWKESVGVTAEIKHALSTGKPVSYLNVHEYLPELGEII